MNTTTLPAPGITVTPEMAQKYLTVHRAQTGVTSATMREILQSFANEILASRLAKPEPTSEPTPPEGFHIAMEEELKHIPVGSKVWFSWEKAWEDSGYIGADRRKSDDIYACPNTPEPTTLKEVAHLATVNAPKFQEHVPVGRDMAEHEPLPVSEHVPPEGLFQSRVRPWMMQCFGPEISSDKLERADRFIEEALELVQATGYASSRAHALVDYVFGRPMGEPIQEVGGVMVTLAALCLAHGMDMHEGGERELTRIMQPEIIDKIRRKQAAKPTGSALPSTITPPAPAVESRQAEQLKELRQVILDAVPLPAVEAQEKSLGQVLENLIYDCRAHAKDIKNIRWGHDGDGGSTLSAEQILEVCDAAEAQAVALAATAPLKQEVERLKRRLQAAEHINEGYRAMSESLADSQRKLNYAEEHLGILAKSLDMEGRTWCNLVSYVVPRVKAAEARVKELEAGLIVESVGAETCDPNHAKGWPVKITVMDKARNWALNYTPMHLLMSAESQLATARQDERQACVERMRKLRDSELREAIQENRVSSIYAAREIFVKAVLSGDPAPDSSPEAESEPEWSTHDGGECPISDDARLWDFKLRYTGDKSYSASQCPSAYNLQWKDKGDYGITAYRVLEWEADQETAWAAHDGGPCPLTREAVELWEWKLRDGRYWTLDTDPTKHGWTWKPESKFYGDVVAYRVLAWKPGFGPKVKITARATFKDQGDTQPQVALEAKDVPMGELSQGPARFHPRRAGNR